MSNVTALEEIRQDKKALEEKIRDLCREFEEKYPGFEIEGVEVSHPDWRSIEHFKKFRCTLQIKIPWL